MGAEDQKDIALVPQMGLGQSDVNVSRARWIFAAILVLAVSLKLVFLFGPWSGSDDDFQSHFGAWAVGEPAERMARSNFAPETLMPVFWRVELPDGTVAEHVYTHHPPLYTMLLALSLKVFGHHEASIRFVPFCFSLLMVWAAFRVISRMYGRRAALFASAFLASVPLVAWYGMLAWTEGALAWIVFEQLGAYSRWLKDRRRRYLVIAAAWQLFAGFLDWSGSFLMLGIAIHAMFYMYFREGLRACLPLLIFPLAFAIPVAVHFTHMGLVQSAASLNADTSRTLMSVIDLKMGLGEFLTLQVRYAWRYLGAPGFLLAFLGLGRALVLSVRRQLSRHDGLIFVMLAPGLMYIGFFPQRSFNHDFFWMLGAAGLSLGAASGAIWLARFFGKARENLVLCGLGLTVVSCGAIGSVEQWEMRRDDQMVTLVESLAPIIDAPENVVLTHFGRGMVLPFYARCEIVHSIDAPKTLAYRMRDVVNKLPEERGAYFIFDALRPHQLKSKLALELLGHPSPGEFSTAFDGLVKSMPRGELNGILESLQDPVALVMHKLLAAKHPSTFVVGEDFGVLEIFDLKQSL